MKRLPVARSPLLLLLLTLVTRHVSLAQDDNLTLPDFLDHAQEWLQANVDDRVPEDLLSAVDLDQLDPLLRDLQQRLQGDYVIDLASWREAATNLVATLGATPETAPYADWLRARLDYFEVAEALRLATPPPKTPSGQRPGPGANPTPALERKVWRKHLERRPASETARAYAARLKPVFAAHRLPTELVWVAEVESSFNPTARSPAGAAGLYQLMPATAKSLGLTLRPEDQRLDPELSAAGAARYLRYLYPKFNDWRLVLAAYNAGEGRVQRLLQKTRTTTFDGVAQHLPAETQMYVPKIEAVVLKREGLELAQLKAP